MDDELELLVKIAAGLLASGHYTEIRDDTEPCLKSWDAGKNWREDTAEKHRFNYHVIDDAVLLLDRIKESLVLE